MNQSIRHASAAGLHFALALLLVSPVAMLAQNTSSAPAQNAPTSTGTASESTPPPPHRLNPKRQLRHLTRKLNLNSAEQQEILPILQDRDRQLESLHKDQSFSRQVRQQQRRSINVTAQQKIKALLNDSQKKKYEKMLAKMDKRRRERNQQNGALPSSGTQPNPPGNNGSQPPGQ